MSTVTFSVEMTELRKHVNFVRNGLGASKTDLPQMLFRVEVIGKRANIFASANETFARTEMKVSRPDAEEQDGSFAVLGGKIERLISQVESETVAFKADGENLEAQAGLLLVNFELFDASVLKTIELGLKEHLTMEGLSVNRAHFEEGLVCGRSCTVTNSIRPDVNHVELRKGKMFASDGRKVTIYTYNGFPQEMVFKVPSTALNSVITAVKNIEADNVQVIEGKSYYYVKGNRNEFTLGVRKVERSFPAVDNMIQTQVPAQDEVSVDKNVLSAMLKGVALGLPTDDVRVDVTLTGEGKEATVEVSSINAVNRRSHERANCGRKTKDTISFPISFQHLLSTLDVFKGDSIVDLLILSDKRNMMMVRDRTETREVFTVIPFRTAKAIQEEKKEKEAIAEAKKKTAAPAPTVADAGESVDLEDVAEAQAV